MKSNFDSRFGIIFLKNRKLVSNALNSDSMTDILMVTIAGIKTIYLSVLEIRL